MKVKWSVLFFTAVFFLTGFLAAEDAAMKERFLQRLPVINELKVQAKVGEDNVGKLALRTSLADKENELVAAENADRETVYRDIAAKISTSALEVGKRRALQIAKLAIPGTWLQHVDGHWYQKETEG
jgi:uncharacterized protein YdbL (DUF1318 family)